MTWRLHCSQLTWISRLAVHTLHGATGLVRKPATLTCRLCCVCQIHSTDITVDIQILCERQQEVQELADEYARVYNTFADLQDLGALQAEQCDDIDFDPAVNVDAAVERTKQGMKHLEAVRYTHTYCTGWNCWLWCCHSW